MTLSETTRRTREGSTGWLIQRAARRFEAVMSAALAEHGLTMLEFAVLMRVLETGGQTQAEIGAVYAAPAWKISRALDSLQRAGLAERRRDPLERRVQRIHATAQAQALAPALQATVSATNATALAPLTEAERGQLHALLTRLVAGG